MKLKKIAKLLFISIVVALVVGALSWFLTSFVILRQLNLYTSGIISESLTEQNYVHRSNETSKSANKADAVFHSNQRQLELSKKDDLPNKFSDKQRTIKDDLKIVSDMIRLISFVKTTLNSQQPQNLNSMCESICDRPLWDMAQANYVGPSYMQEFFGLYSAQAFNDYQFRLNLHYVNILSRVVGEDSINFLEKIVFEKNSNFFNQSVDALRVNYELVRLVSRVNEYLYDVEELIEEANSLEELPKSCTLNSLNDIKSKCEQMLNSSIQINLLNKLQAEELKTQKNIINL